MLDHDHHTLIRCDGPLEPFERSLSGHLVVPIPVIFDTKDSPINILAIVMMIDQTTLQWPMNEAVSEWFENRNANSAWIRLPMDDIDWLKAKTAHRPRPIYVGIEFTNDVDAVEFKLRFG